MAASRHNDITYNAITEINHAANLQKPNVNTKSFPLKNLFLKNLSENARFSPVGVSKK